MMVRALVSPILDAFIKVLEDIQVGGATLKVGDSDAPDCDPPYAIVLTLPGGTLEGPIGDPEADAMDRLQVVGVGKIPKQARLVLDEARAALTIDALDTELNLASAQRRVNYVWIDLHRGTRREDQGLPEANIRFSILDQYIVRTTPG